MLLGLTIFGIALKLVIEAAAVFAGGGTVIVVLAVDGPPVPTQLIVYVVVWPTEIATLPEELYEVVEIAGEKLHDEAFEAFHESVTTPPLEERVEGLAVRVTLSVTTGVVVPPHALPVVELNPEVELHPQRKPVVVSNPKDEQAGVVATGSTVKVNCLRVD